MPFGRERGVEREAKRGIDRGAILEREGERGEQGKG